MVCKAERRDGVAVEGELPPNEVAALRLSGLVEVLTGRLDDTFHGLRTCHVRRVTLPASLGSDNTSRARTTRDEANEIECALAGRDQVMRKFFRRLVRELHIVDIYDLAISTSSAGDG